MGITLEVLIISGILAWTLSFFGYFGMKKEEKEWIIIVRIVISAFPNFQKQEILLLTGFMMEMICILLWLWSPGKGQESKNNGENLLYPLGDINVLCLFMYIIIFAHLFIMVNLFFLIKNNPSFRFSCS